MKRLLVHVEGPTEEEFVRSVLATDLIGCGLHSVVAKLVGKHRKKDQRGGIRPWPQVKKEILNRLREDVGSAATTMVDYYALDYAGRWPGHSESQRFKGTKKATVIEDKLLDEVVSEMGPSFDKARFIPFVVLHEFEGLLFSDCVEFSRAIGSPHLSSDFQAIRDLFETPEDINDSTSTAPSKRVEALMPQYRKPVFGRLAMLGIGLETIRKECPHFNSWISKLESLPLL